MSYASLMVHVDVDSDLSGRASLAAGLADRFGARLIGVAGWAPMSLFLDEEEKPEPTRPELQDMQALLDQKGNEFWAASGTPDRQVEWRSALALPIDVVAPETRAADPIVLGN